MTDSHDPPPGLSRLEILGAWLHVWTPHRDAEVPPIPWRIILRGGLVVAVAGAIAAAIVVPRIDRAKQDSARKTAAETAARHAATRARLVEEQRAHRGQGPRAFAPLYEQAQAAVLADARARARAGDLKGPIRELRCDRVSGARAGTFDCTAVTDRIAATEVNAGGALGYPFRLRLDVPAGAYVWCKQNPIAGEQSIPDPDTVVQLPKACRG